MREPRKLVAFVLLCAIWGSTWLVIKVGYGGLGPFNVAGLRFLVAGLVLVPLVPVMKARWPRGREWWLVLWVGTMLFALDYGLIYWAEQSLDSGMTAVLFSTLPVVTAILAHLYLPAERLTPRTLGGALLALVGVTAIFWERLSLDAGLALPVLAMEASAVCAAAASVATKRHGKDLHPAALNAGAMLWGALLLGVASWLAGDGLSLPSDAPTWGAVLYLALAGSVVTFLLYFWLLRSWRATTVSFISVVTTLVAVVLGFFVLGERPSTPAFAGGALVLAGITLALAPRRAVAPEGKPLEEPQG